MPGSILDQIIETDCLIMGALRFDLGNNDQRFSVHTRQKERKQE
jgi:hypothetical protein